MSERRRPRLGLPIFAVIGLALLAVPRAILHDLDIIHEQTFVNLLFVITPPAIWVLVAVVRRVANPFLTLVAVGACYGVFLALVHQLLWTINAGDSPPSLGGNLSDLPPLAESVIVRGAAVISSLFTGVITGAVAGLVGWGLARLVTPERGQG